jgi:broad specificity phosphatase PhoE
VTILLVRHGRTATNAAGLFLGRADPELDDAGRAQAEAIGKVIGRVERVISSPLRRTMETARCIDGPVTIDDRFIELDYGEWDGRPLSDVGLDEWVRWREDLEFAPPGGESIGALGRRVRSALDELEADAQRSDIAIVTHVSPLKAAVAWALGVEDRVAWHLFVSPGSISRLEVGGRGRSLVSFNEISHLSRP